MDDYQVAKIDRLSGQFNNDHHIDSERKIAVLKIMLQMYEELDSGEMFQKIWQRKYGGVTDPLF